MQQANFIRIAIITGSVICLGLVYLFQQFSYFGLINVILGGILPESGNLVFIVNKTTRLIINDLICMGLIYALFMNRDYIQLAFYLFLAELLLILPIYFTIKLNWEGTSEISSPLLSPIHRMVVNPLLMLLYIVALVYQRKYLTPGSKQKK